MLKAHIRNAFLSHGINITRCVETAKVLELAHKLRPLDCGIELIRIGGDGDGGYLLPNDIEGIDYCFSPGVADVADFELQLVSKGITCFLADGSVDAPPIGHNMFVFDKTFLGNRNTNDLMTLQTWKDHYLPNNDHDLLLQMDIEGCEYEVILNMSDELIRQFRIIIIEFHHLDLLLTNHFAFDIYESCFEKLLNYHYIAHIHPNNCCGVVTSNGIEMPRTMEFTFIRKDRVCSVQPVSALPHPLDRDNVPSKPPIILPQYWMI